ncbi:MAG: aminotransferase class I/II-fold pyridoxal phosphate-dependent enzyme [Robiginitalea sp.]
MNVLQNVIPGPELQVEGQTYLYFGGTSYLGMQTDPEFLRLLARYTRQIGSHLGASRTGNIQLGTYEHAEKSLAKWIASPSCLTLSSGFLAARLLADYFRALEHPCFFSPNCHEALLPVGTQRSPDWETLYHAVEDCPEKLSGTLPVVFTDTMGSSTHAGPVWEQLQGLPRACILVADDSHGLGIVGADGSGSWKTIAAMGFNELVLCGSLGKALGITSGVVSGLETRIAALRKTGFFAGASPAPPAGLAAMAEALEEGWYLKKFRRLIESVTFLRQQTGHLKFLNFSSDYPVITFRNRPLSKYLLENKVLITDFQYAAEGGATSPSRIVISSAHQDTHLRSLVNLLLSFEESA